ncbi:putative phage abortive infection protein [Acinetobacter piscicola]|uniref:putative phage abortive infection protein n=1 Tax=Acinetobacter piscicola TaxID=2006115 RepID=UPI00355603B5
MSDTPKNKDLTEFFAILGTLIIIFCIWLSYPRILTAMDEPTPLPKVDIPYKLPAISEQTEDTNKSQFENVGEKYGTYGDSYGSLNTLFSGLAFAVLIISMFMQRQELREQRKELAQQREELAAQRKEAEQSNKIAEGQRKITEQQARLIEQQIDEAKVQNFYFVLFKHLENLDIQLNRIQFIPMSSEGENALKQISSIFLKCIRDNNIKDGALVFNKELCIQQLYDLRKRNSRFNGSDFLKSLYFENILLILRFIKEHENSIEVRQPTQILISNISNDAIICLMWLAITSESNELTKFIERYGLLRSIESTLNYESKILFEAFFDTTAFREI